MRIKNRLIFSVVSLLIILTSQIGSTIAISGDGLAAYPANPDPNDPQSASWFIYNLNRGESKQDALTIKNDSDKKQTVKIYAVDSTTNNVGEFALEEEKDSKDGIGKWIQLESNSVDLAPNEQKQVKFTISIPADAPAGENSGGIIIQKEKTAEEKNPNGGFIISTRIGIRVYETIPGRTRRKVSFGKSTLKYDDKNRMYTLDVVVKNESDVSVEPDLKININDTLFGAQNQSLEQKTQIPRDGEVISTFTFKKPKIGKFEIVPQATYKKTDGTSETVIDPQKISFWTLPWDEIIIVSLLIFANILFLVVLKLLSRREKKYYKSYRVQSGEDLKSISHKLGTEWKKIAAINKIKPPYHIEEGQIITVFDKKDMLEQIYMESEKLQQTAETRKRKNQAFDQDLAQISQSSKKNIFSLAGKKLGLRKDVCAFILSAIGLLLASYLLYINLFIKNNRADFFYETEKKQPAAQTQEENTTTKTQPTAQNSANSQTETAAAESTDTQTDNANIEITAEDRKNVKIEILNGSGVKGASNRIAAAFKEKGYSAISTGNADNFRYTQTLLQCASDIRTDICEEAKEVLAQNHQNISTAADKTVEKGKIKIILGK